MLGRVFNLMYKMTSGHRSGQSIHMTSTILEMIINAIQNGIRQRNYIEMIEFFRWATFISNIRGYSDILVNRDTLSALILCIRYCDQDYDHVLREFYQAKRSMEIELREYRQMAQRTPDKPYDNNRDLALVD